jgi:hypothetical protein
MKRGRILVNDREEIASHVDKTLIHKIHVLQGARILIKYLIENNKIEVALELAERCSVHDNSKFQKEEMSCFLKIPESNDNLTNPNSKLDDEMKSLLRMHWDNNRHHPEHYNGLYDNMESIDIMEMAIDCYARSIEMNTDLIIFIEVRQRERFVLPEEKFEELKTYCYILLGKEYTSGSNNKVYKKEISK